MNAIALQGSGRAVHNDWNLHTRPMDGERLKDPLVSSRMAHKGRFEPLFHTFVLQTLFEQWGSSLIVPEKPS